MPIVYKTDILHELKKAGFTTYRLRKEKIIGEATVQKMRNREPLNWDNLSKLCQLLHCQPGDLIEYTNEP